VTTVGFSGILGLWVIGSVPSALLLILPGIVLYFFAKRSGPAAAALSALFGLGLLSVVPILALAPLPKWWTVQWVSMNSARLPSRDGPEIQYPPSASDRPWMAPASLAPVAEENRTASLPAVPPPEPSQSFAATLGMGSHFSLFCLFSFSVRRRNKVPVRMTPANSGGRRPYASAEPKD